MADCEAKLRSKNLKWSVRDNFSKNETQSFMVSLEEDDENMFGNCETTGTLTPQQNKERKSREIQAKHY